MTYARAVQFFKQEALHIQGYELNLNRTFR